MAWEVESESPAWEVEAEEPIGPRRGGTRAEAKPFVAGEALAPSDPRAFGASAVSDVAGGRGSPPSALDVAAMRGIEPQPFRSKAEAIDSAVDDISGGATADEVFAAYARVGVTKPEIITRGRALHGEGFWPNVAGATDFDSRPALRRESAEAFGEATPVETTFVRELGKAGRRGALQLGGMAEAGLFHAGALRPSDMARFVRERNSQLQAYGPSGDVQVGLERLNEANERGSMGDVVKEIFTPEGLQALAALVVESALPSAAVLPAAALGSVAGPGGTAAGVGAASFSLEFAGALNEVLQNERINPNDALAVQRALEDPEFMAKVRDRGVRRGLAVGTVDAVSAGFAGRFLKTIERAAEAGKIAPGAVGRARGVAGLKELGVQAGAGAAGEVLGQATVGEYKPLDILVEAVAEGPTGLVEAGLNVAQRGPAPAVPRVEDMPTTPLTPEQIEQVAAARAPEAGPQGKEAVMEPSAPAPAAAAPATIGVAGVPRGALAEAAGATLAGGQDGGGVQPAGGLAAQPAAAAGQTGAAPGADLAGGGPAGSVRAPVRPAEPAVPGAPGPDAAGRVADAAPEPTDPALSAAGALQPFATAGQALAYAAQERIAGGVTPVQIAGGWVLSPKETQASRRDVARDAVAVAELNDELVRAGWRDGSGAPLRATVSAAESPLSSAVRTAVGAAFGVRVVAISGFPGNGVQIGRTAYITTEKTASPGALLGVTGHEALHWLETNDADAAASLYSGIAPFLRPGAVSRQLRQENAALLPGETPITEKRALSEVVANVNGAMWLDSKFWGRLYELDNGSTFRRVLYRFMGQASKLARALAGTTFDASRYVTEVEKVREVAARVWAERAQGRRAGKTVERGPVRGARQSRAPEYPAGAGARGDREARPFLESDKAFAKRAVDRREDPGPLSEVHEDFFALDDDTQIVPLDMLVSTKPPAPEDFANARRRMDAARRGELSKRPPVSVRPHPSGDGRFEVLDGNASVGAARAMGWESIPVIDITNRYAPELPAGWTKFPEEAGGLGILREEMPQVKLKDLPELLAHMKKNGVASFETAVRADLLKPTQAEYSPAKVAKALERGLGTVRGLASIDGHVLDGHHRWKAAADAGMDFPLIVFNAPARTVLELIWKFPKVRVDEGSRGVGRKPPELDRGYVAEVDLAANLAAGVVDRAIAERVAEVIKRFPAPNKLEVPAVDQAKLAAIYQPVLNLADGFADSFRKSVEEVAESVGAEAHVAPKKSLKRVIEKAHEEHVVEGILPGAGTIRDILRASVVVASVADVPAAVEAIRSRYEITRLKDRFEKPMNGYRDVLINVAVPGFGQAEIQVHIREMFIAKELGHLAYAIERAARWGPGRAVLNTVQGELYEAAFNASGGSLARPASTSLSNSSRETSMPSRITRPTDIGPPVSAEAAETQPGATTIGTSLTSQSLAPGTSRAFQSNIASPPSTSVSPDGVGPTYVSRLVANGEDIASWARAQGIVDVVPPTRMHVTLAYSRSPVDRGRIVPQDQTMTVRPGGRRIEVFNDDAVVLTLESADLQSRWRELLDAGATWDFGRRDGGYQPHITLSYEPQSIDVSKIRPYTGAVILGPERVESLRDGFSEEVKGEIDAAPKLARITEPGEGVADENQLGFWPALRVKVDGVEVPEKPRVLVGTNNKNAPKQLAELDGVLARHPDAAASPENWAAMQADAFASDEVPVPPFAFIRDLAEGRAVEKLGELTQGQIDDATHGFENAAEFRRRYRAGQMSVATTGKLLLWSFLSRGVSPYTQESLFIDAFNGAAPWIERAAAGQFTEADLPAYQAWVDTVKGTGTGQPGAGASHNLGAFGRNFLLRMGAPGPDGTTFLARFHQMLGSDMTGPQIRREFATFGEGVGIDNKVVSFTLLVAGFDDVMVLDRVQIRQLWDDGRFADVNLYDGLSKKTDKPVRKGSATATAAGKVRVAGSSLAPIGEGVRGLLIYEAIERALGARVQEIYSALGRPEHASIGRYHWETWVADSQQEASHGTLGAVLKDAKGDDNAIANVFAKQGEYGAFQYGAQYARDEAGQPWFRYTLDGQSWDFSLPAFRAFLDVIQNAKNGVVYRGFLVTNLKEGDDGIEREVDPGYSNGPWYARPRVNRARLAELAAQHADRGAERGRAAEPIVVRPPESADRGRARARPRQVAPAEARLSRLLADDYAALEGRRLRVPVTIEDTGQSAVMELGAADYMRDLDRRATAARELVRCLG